MNWCSRVFFGVLFASSVGCEGLHLSESIGAHECNVRDVNTDGRGRLWLHCASEVRFAEGLVVPRVIPFPRAAQERTMLVSSPSQLWMLSDGVLERWNGTMWEREALPITPASVLTHTYFAAKIGMLVTTAEQAVRLLFYDGQRWSVHELPPALSMVLHEQELGVLAFDPQGNLWVSSQSRSLERSREAPPIVMFRWDQTQWHSIETQGTLRVLEHRGPVSELAFARYGEGGFYRRNNDRLEFVNTAPIAEVWAALVIGEGSYWVAGPLAQETGPGGCGPSYNSSGINWMCWSNTYREGRMTFMRMNGTQRSTYAAYEWLRPLAIAPLWPAIEARGDEALVLFHDPRMMESEFYVHDTLPHNTISRPAL